MAKNIIEVDRLATLKVLEDKLVVWEKEETDYENIQAENDTNRKEFEKLNAVWNKEAAEYIVKNIDLDDPELISLGYRNDAITLNVRHLSIKQVEMVIGKKPELKVNNVVQPESLRRDEKGKLNIERLRNTVQMLKLSTQTTISGSLAKNAFDLL